MSTAHDRVVSLLAAGRGRLLRRTLSAGALRTVAAAAFLLAVSILLLLLRPPAIAAAAISCAALALAVAALTRYLALPAARVPALEPYSVRVDGLLGEGRNVAINALELGRRLAAERDPFTRALIAAHVSDAAREIEGADLDAIGRARGLGRWGAGLGGSLAALVAVFAFVPGPSTQAAHRLLHPRLSDPPAVVGLVVEPGDVEVDTGSDVTVRARLTGTRRQPLLRFAAAGAEWTESDMAEAAPDTGARAYEYTFASLDHDVNYQVSVAGQSSRTWKIRVTDPPRALGYRIRYDYPRYSELPPETRVAATGDVSALVGTKITLEVEVNDPEAGGYLAFGDRNMPLQRGGDSMSRLADFTVSEARRYRVHLADGKGRERFTSPEFAVDPVPDRAPIIKVLSPGRDVDLPEDMKLQITAATADDYGLTRLVLHSQVGDAPEQRADIARLSGREATTLYEWDLSALDLVPGDVVSYYLEVFDNDAVSGPNSTRSDAFTVRFPTMDEIYADLNEERDQEVQGLEETREDQQRLKKQVEEASREMKKGLEAMNWDKQQELSSMAKQQQTLQERLGEIQKSLEQSADQIEKNDLMGEEMVQKLSEIQQLMSQIQNRDLKDAIQRLQEAVQKMSRSDVQRALDKMKMTQDDLLKSLDRTIEMLKRLQMEEKLAQQIEKAADMLDRQDKINDQLDHSPDSDAMKQMEQQQKGLSDDLQQSQDQLQQLQNDAQTQHPQMAQALQQTMQQQDLQSTQQEMQQAQQSMQQQNSSRAGQHGRRSRQGLQNLLAGLQQAQASMSQQMTAELSAKITRIQNDLLDVSKTQEDVLGASAETPPQKLAETQGNLASAAKRAADGLFEISKETPFVTPQLGRMIGAAIAQLQQATEAFAAGDRSNGMDRGKQSQVSVNQTILALMQQNQSMCQNPGSSGMNQSMSQIQQLGQQQQQLNTDTRSFAQQFQQRLQESGDEELARLAARQEMIKKGLDEVHGQLGERSDVLGRLDQIAEDMGDLAQKMREEGVPDEVLQQQERILSRLLDAQRSVRKQDYSQRRRSEPGQDFANRPSPAAIPPALLEAKDRLQTDILRGAADPYPAEYRRLVEEYFRALTSESKP